MTTRISASTPARPVFRPRHGANQPPSTRAEGDLVRDAFRKRASHAVEQIAASASLEALAQALEAPTDFGAIAVALGNAAMPQAARELDPLADALARGAAERERLATLAGGLLSASDTGKALGGISRQAVDKRRRTNQLLAVRVGGDWCYPAGQIGADGQVPVFLRVVLQDGVQLGMSGWAMMDFLLAPDDTLGGQTPMDVLARDGPDIQAVRRLLAASKADAFG